jgi:virulence-associated protein VagC
VGGTFHDEKDIKFAGIPPRKVKTIKEGQMFIISPVPLHELPESCKSLCKSFSKSFTSLFTLSTLVEESEPEADEQEDMILR